MGGDWAVGILGYAGDWCVSPLLLPSHPVLSIPGCLIFHSVIISSFLCLLVCRISETPGRSPWRRLWADSLFSLERPFSPLKGLEWWVQSLESASWCLTSCCIILSEVWLVPHFSTEPDMSPCVWLQKLTRRMRNIPWACWAALKRTNDWLNNEANCFFLSLRVIAPLVVKGVFYIFETCLGHFLNLTTQISHLRNGRAFFFPIDFH